MQSSNQYDKRYGNEYIKKLQLQITSNFIFLIIKTKIVITEMQFWIIKSSENLMLVLM